VGYEPLRMNATATCNLEDSLWLRNKPLKENHLLNIQYEELYNLTADPGEMNDLFDDPDTQTWLASMSTTYSTIIQQNRTAN
jgi:hypothetical protein